MSKICNECNINIGKKSSYYNMILCNLCNELDKYKLMCKTDVKKTYLLNDKDLDDIEYYEVKNPHYRCASSMLLYNKKDIINKCVEKYVVNYEDVYKFIEVIKEDRKIKNEKKKETIKKKKEQRKEILVDALKEYKLTLRADSQLCEEYINGRLKNMSIDDIVQRMCQMRFLYEYCDFNKCYNEAKKIKYEDHNYEYEDMPLFNIAEVIALKKCGGYPDVFPWMS